MRPALCKPDLEHAKKTYPKKMNEAKSLPREINDTFNKQTIMKCDTIANQTTAFLNTVFGKDVPKYLFVAWFTPKNRKLGRKTMGLITRLKNSIAFKMNA